MYTRINRWNDIIPYLGELPNLKGSTLGGLPIQEICSVEYSLVEEKSGHLGGKEKGIEYLGHRSWQVAIGCVVFV